MDESFSFRTSEIIQFIDVAPNRTHEVAVDCARAIWISERFDFENRLEFGRRMIHRIATGKHRRQASQARYAAPLDDIGFLFQAYLAAAPDDTETRLVTAIEDRSTSNGSANRALKERHRQPGRPPPTEVFQAIDAAQSGKKYWARAGDRWICPCCERNRLEICRRSNTKKWTAKVQRIVDYIEEADPRNRRWRRLTAFSPVIIGSHHDALICQDCRNVIVRVLQAHRGLPEHALLVDDIRELVGRGTPHTDHDVDLDEAAAKALGATSRAAAIDEYWSHRRLAIRAYLQAWRLENTRSTIATGLLLDLIRRRNLNFGDTEAYAEWMIEEGKRFVAGEQSWD